MLLLVLFPRTSFKIVSLPASVSEFNCRCFLRSRCSMEMWCPDDIRRDSWDCVGTYLGESMIQLSRVGVEAPRLLKRNLSRLYYCCCCIGCVFNSVYVHSCECNASHSHETDLYVAEHLGVRLPANPPPLSPRQLRNLSGRGLSKKSAESWDSTSKWTESEKCP